MGLNAGTWFRRVFPGYFVKTLKNGKIQKRHLLIGDCDTRCHYLVKRFYGCLGTFALQKNIPFLMCQVVIHLVVEQSAETSGVHLQLALYTVTECMD